MWEGLSIYETLRQAAKQAANLNYQFGEFIAELAIPDDDLSIHIDPGRSNSGHRNLRVEPLEDQAEQALAFVVAVHTVNQIENGGNFDV
jgi:hypothetical protein